MAVLRAGQTYADFTKKFIREDMWGLMGAVVQRSITKLEDEGFTREEAEDYLEELTIIQLYRMNFPLPPVSIEVYIPDPIVYTEQQIMDMTSRGETIPVQEYAGFEGYY